MSAYIHEIRNKKPFEDATVNKYNELINKRIGDQKVVTALQKCCQTFIGTLEGVRGDVRKVTIRTYETRRYRGTLFDDPFFWYWLGASNRPHCCHVYHPITYSYLPNVPSRPLVTLPNINLNAGNVDLDEQAKRLGIVALGLIVLSDFAALALGVMVTKNSVDIALETEKKVLKDKTEIVDLLETIALANEEIREPLNKIIKNFKDIEYRALKEDRFKVLATGLFCSAGVLFVHATISLIAAAILESYIAAGATGFGLQVFTFCVVSSSPMMWLAIGVIAMLGAAIHVGLAIYDRKNKDFENSRQGLEDTVTLLSTIDSLPKPPGGTSQQIFTDPLNTDEGQPPQYSATHPSAPPHSSL